MKRVYSLDILRGLAIGYLVFVHGTLYNYSQIDSVDISRIPWPLIIVGILGLWGGVFMVYSLVVNSRMLLKRGGDKVMNLRLVLPLIFGGLAYIFIVGTLQTLIFGRWAANLAADSNNLTVVAQFIRGDTLNLNWFMMLAGSGIKTVGFNLVIVPLVLYVLFRRTGLRDKRNVYMKLIAIALVILALSFGRIFMFDQWFSDVLNGNIISGWLGSLLIANPYPGIAYLSYGFLGVAMGMMLYYTRRDLLKKYMLPLGVFLILTGLVIVALNPATIYSASWFWYGKIIAETGCFVLLFSFAILVAIRNRMSELGRRLVWLVGPLGRISLTVYMLEVTTSELLRPIWFSFDPGWSNTYAGPLLIGATNAIIWLIIAHVWKRFEYRYSVEYLWVRTNKYFGKKSTKLNISNY